MANLDFPITLNVGGEIFMTSLTTVQTLPNTLLANLANSLYINGGDCSSSNTKINNSADPLNSYTSRFIHVIAHETQDDKKVSSGHERNTGTQIHGPTPNSLFPKYSSTAAGVGSKVSVFVDRNPILMPYILDLYRTGQLHLPSNVCSPLIRSELQFWGISENLIGACCWKKFDEGVSNLRIIDIITKSLFNPYDTKDARDALSGMAKVWMTMERPSYSLAAKIWCVFYFAFIFVSMVVFSIGSLPDHRRVNPAFEDLRADTLASNESVSLVRMMSFTTQIESISIANTVIDVFFSIEFLVRLITCPDKKAFLKSAHNIVDTIILLVAWLNFLLETGFANNPDSYGELESHVNVIFSCCVVVRVFRVCHIAKHMPAMKLMYLSAKESAAELTLLIAAVGSAILLLGTAMFLVETFDKLPGDMGSFRHVPYAMWWAVITMTTVGYGDFYPTTTAGYFVGTICAMSGLLLIAMPIAVIATNFSDYYYNMTSRDHLIQHEEYVKEHRVGHLSWTVTAADTASDDGGNITSSPAVDTNEKGGGYGGKTGKDNPLKIQDLEAT